MMLISNTKIDFFYHFICCNCVNDINKLMYQYKYEDVDMNADPTDVALHNMKIADKSLNLTFFVSGAQGWMRANKNKSFNDLEKELRKRSFNTHLFAKQVKLAKGSKIFIPERTEDKTEYKYECIFSCRPKREALSEVLHHWKTYDENLEALKYAGYVVIENIDTLRDRPDVQKIDDTEIQNLQGVCENKKRIISEYKTAEKVISEINVTIREKYGVDPLYKPLGTSQDGPIYVAVVGKQIVSDIGYVKKHVSGGTKLELVQIQ